MLRGKRSAPLRVPDHRQGADPLDPGVGHLDRVRRGPRRPGAVHGHHEAGGGPEPACRLEALEASILESIPHAVIGLKNRQIIFANDGVEKVFGWKREEVIGKSTRIFYRSKKEWADGADNLYRSLETHKTFTAEVVRKKRTAP